MPVHKHDCSTCKYLGTFKMGYLNRPTDVVDLYFHRGIEITVIARHSDEESDYESGLESPSRYLLLATLLAVKEGLLSKDEIPNYWIEKIGG